MKIIFDNIIYSLQHHGGISVVWTNLISRMLNVHHDILFIEYDGCNNNISRKTFDIPSSLIDNHSSHLMCLRRYLNPKVKSEDKFIFHSSYFRTCSNINSINITTVHDFTYEYFVSNPLKRNIHSHQKFNAIRHSRYIVCISENTKKDLLKFLPDVNPDKIFVIYNGISDDFYKIDNAKSSRDYILFVGNRNGYKNFDKVIESVGISGKTLFIVGKKLTVAEESMLKRYNCKYNYLGFVDDKELNTLYNNAYCLIYPSSYEGFGLPVIEAQRAGCPVIAYNGSSISEICDDKSLLVDDISTAKLLEKIKMLSDKSICEKIVSAGLENSSRYTWDKALSKYGELYEKAYNDCL
jgi:mannosyltransferase